MKRTMGAHPCKGAPLSGLAGLGFVVACIWVAFNVRRWNNREVLQWDTDGYYLYLPATIIHHDLFGLSFLDGIAPNGFQGGYRFGQGAYLVPGTGRYCDKYTMGTAVFELPFFLMAHTWCLITDRDAADGYSPPYHLAVAFSSAIWAWLGLLALRRFLLRHVTDALCAIVLLVIGLGTNLFFYASYAQGMAHPVLFFLCALLIERTSAWYERPTMGRAMLIGACIGMATLVRPTCALFALIPLCWSMGRNTRHRLATHGSCHRIAGPLAAIATAVLCVLPQLFYWKAASGQYLFYSYGTETFDLTRPHVLEALFGFRKGWFVYTPAALVALSGLIVLWRSDTSTGAAQDYVRMCLLFLIPFVYLTFSWETWWYGGGFGSRVMIDVLPLLAWPLAALVQRVSQGGAWFRTGSGLLLVGCITLNLFQQWQYQRGIIHYEAMTFERWCQVFGRSTSIGLPAFP